jgi:hypothetical protein
MAGKNIFENIQVKAPRRSTHDLTHDHKLSTNFGDLTPVLVMECVPGDTFHIGADSLVRMQPMVFPVMHRADAYIHYWFVPNRIVWPNWEDFITDPESVGLPVIEVDDSLDPEWQKFLDYMGVPPSNTSNAVEVNALPLAAYQCIYNEWYRDENLIAEVPYQLSPGINLPGPLTTLRKRAWEHDYFTSALPWAQKGNPVEVPLAKIEANAPLRYNDPSPPLNTGVTGNVSIIPVPNSPDPALPNQELYAETLGLPVGGTQVDDLRRAFVLQEFLELNARGGTRYIEQILAHFGQKSSDARLNRPEMISGSHNPITISEVLNTAGSVGANPQGAMAGHGVSVGQGNFGSYHIEEHGYIIGIMSVMPKTAYQQGIPRHYLRKEPLDFYWPKFQHIGEQAIMQDEIYAYQGNGDSEWGYIPRYSEFKYIPSQVSGQYRTTLNQWHMGRIFQNLPTLSQQFVEMDSEEVDRIFAVTDPNEDKLLCHVLHKIKAVRPMDFYGIPTIASTV